MTSNQHNNFENQEEEQKIDTRFRDMLADFETAPPEDNWVSVTKKIPLHLQLRKQLIWLSRIAVALVLFMGITVYFNNKEVACPACLPDAGTATPDDPSSSNTKAQPLTADHPTNANIVTRIQESHQKKDLEALLDLITSRDLMDQNVDDDIIAKALEPLNQLPIEGIVATLPSKNIPAGKSKSDMHISNPLEVVGLLNKNNNQDF